MFVFALFTSQLVSRHTVTLGVRLCVMILGGVFDVCVCVGGGDSVETAQCLHPPEDASVT